jgi:uncharacterized caspase-like protein
MRKVIMFSVLLSLVGCAHYKYEAKEELGKQRIESSRLSRYDLVMGIQFKDQTEREVTEAVKGDLALEMADWFVSFLDEGRNFKKVVNLNQSAAEEVDVILKGTIKSITVEEPGISGTSKALAIFYGVAPVLEHYAKDKVIDSSATVSFQLLEPRNHRLLWNRLVTEKARDKIPLSQSNKLIFASVTKTVESLLTETDFPEALERIGGAQPSTAALATKEEYAKPSLVAPSLHGTAISQRWAVIIGISNYDDSHIPSLRYAAADAQSFCDWLTSPKGGRYAPSRVKLLVNEKATGRNIKEALFVWLKQALEEDMIIIFFAGHGSPESPDSPENLFLLPYDAQYDNIATTGFPMWDIKTALRRFIKAKKVVVIADACHAGGVGKAFDVARRASRAIKINPISSGLQDLSTIGDGVAVMSASDDKQFSQESQKWGGGHGAFTYFLLNGLNGEADYNHDKQITLGELIPFVSEQVRRATKNAQCPTVAGKFDPALSIRR